MEAPVQPMVQMRDEWTVADLHALEVEDWHRYEIVDGALVVSPSPGRSHELAIARLHRLLVEHVPEQLEVLSGNLGVAFGRSYRVPDLVVVRSSFFSGTADTLAPEDVRLAAEVVSPGSITTDRVTKPAQYAGAGIANFWRVETDPLSLTAYTLDGVTYREVGTWHAGETAHLEHPFPVEIEVDRLG